MGGLASEALQFLSLLPENPKLRITLIFLFNISQQQGTSISSYHFGIWRIHQRASRIISNFIERFLILATCFIELPISTINCVDIIPIILYI